MENGIYLVVNNMSDDYLKQENITYKEDGIGWVLIPPTVMASSELNNSQKMLMGRIMGLVKKKGYCYASNGWLGNQLNLAPKTVSNYIEKLREVGFVERKIIRNEEGQVTERRLYAQINNTPPINNNMDTPPHKYVEGSVRDSSVRDNKQQEQSSQYHNIDFDYDDPSKHTPKDLVKIFNTTLNAEQDYVRETINWGQDIGIMSNVRKKFDGSPAETREFLEWIARRKFNELQTKNTNLDKLGFLFSYVNDFKNWRKKRARQEELEKQIDAGAPDPDESVDSMQDARDIMG